MPDDAPASPWHDALRRELLQRQNDGLLRSLRAFEAASSSENGAVVRRLDADGRPIGSPLINLASNDYLGLAAHPRLIDAAVRATQRYGTGSGAARLVTGTGPLHQQAELAFAKFKHAERALLLPTGYTANLVAITTLAQPGDLICIDKLNHASLIDAARASGATLRVFPHLDPRKLERIL
jgi:7-keto-8-aminopelargonate synthetase-like enzyme